MHRVYTALTQNSWNILVDINNIVLVRLYVFITIKKHFKELSKQQGHYEKLLNEISSFHQKREEQINRVIDIFYDRFSNKSATVCMHEIRKIIKLMDENKKNGRTEEAI